MTKRASKHKSRFFRRFAKANEAVSALEYAILVGVIAVAVGAALVAFGEKITGAVAGIGTDINNIDTAGAPTMNAPAPF